MLLSIITAHWNGTNVPLKEGSTFTLGGLVAEAQVVGNGIDSANKVEASVIKLNVAITTGVQVTVQFPPGAKGELQVQADSGQTFIWSDAFRTGGIPITAGQGMAEVTLSGGTPVEI